jgi:hypothetical protein
MVEQNETRDDTHEQAEGGTDIAMNSTGGDDSDAPVEMAAEEEPMRPAKAVGPGAIRADVVNLNQGGASTIEAKTVSITNGGAANVRAEELSITNGGVALARTGSLTIKQGGSSFLALADNAEVEEGGSVFLLVAKSTSGGVRPMLDWRAALAVGAGFGLALSLIRRVLR